MFFLRAEDKKGIIPGMVFLIFQIKRLHERLVRHTIHEYKMKTNKNAGQYVESSVWFLQGNSHL